MATSDVNDDVSEVSPRLGRSSHLSMLSTYTSPEQERRGEIEHRSPVSSMGSVKYRMDDDFKEQRPFDFNIEPLEESHFNRAMTSIPSNEPFISRVPSQERPTGAIEQQVRQSIEGDSASSSDAFVQTETPSRSRAPRSSPGLWWPSAFMIALTALGIGIALAHHFSYQSLDNEPITNFPQMWATNLGILAALLVRICFTFAIGLAFQEVLWYSLRKRLTKIGSIGKLFSVESNFLGFLSIDAFKTAPLALLIAAVVWLVPMIVVLTPGTLEVRILPSNSSSIAPKFSRLRNISQQEGESPLLSTGGPGIPSYGASDELQKLALRTLNENQIVSQPSPCSTNCSIPISIAGPMLQCNYTRTPYSEERAVLTPYNCTAQSWGIEVTYLNNAVNSSYSRNYARQEESPDPDFRSISCRAYNATYMGNITYDNNLPTYNIQTISNGPLNKTYLEPNFIGVDQINIDMMLTQVIFGYLIGTIDTQRFTQVETTHLAMASKPEISNAAEGKLPPLHFRVLKDLSTGIPELLKNLTISTWSWNSTQAPDAEGSQVYTYDPRWLAIPYGIATALTLLCSWVGTVILQHSRVRTGGPFLQILTTTRNPVLDEMVARESLSLTSHGAEWLKDQKIRLGELRDVNKRNGELDRMGTGHAAFGVREQTLALEEGRTYC